jgi:hypothetical protein
MPDVQNLYKNNLPQLLPDEPDHPIQINPHQARALRHPKDQRNRQKHYRFITHPMRNPLEVKERSQE